MEHNTYSSGNWWVTEGREDEFVARWTEFLQWTRDSVPGLEHAQLMRDDGNPSHFLSTARWRDAESRSDWQQQPKFQDLIGACIKLCDDVHTSTYQQVVTIDSPGGA
jgi:heme-degrading monooxygenase HmoA